MNTLKKGDTVVYKPLYSPGEINTCQVKRIGVGKFYDIIDDFVDSITWQKVYDGHGERKIFMDTGSNYLFPEQVFPDLPTMIKSLQDEIKLYQDKCEKFKEQTGAVISMQQHIKETKEMLEIAENTSL